MFCPECGTDHHAEDRIQQTAVDREIELARINAKRDVDVARIAAGQTRAELETAEAIAEVQADAEVEAAVVEGEVIAAALEASDVDAEPIEIVAPDVITTVDTDIEQAPPETDGSPVPTESKPRGLGMWLVPESGPYDLKHVDCYRRRRPAVRVRRIHRRHLARYPYAIEAPGPDGRVIYTRVI